MLLKDYYSILQISPGADREQIKQAYRKLAKQHHPDKNENDPYSTAQFNEIKEAYEVLTDPARKEKYLQERWYNESLGKRKTQPVITPVNILRQSLELEKYTSTLDVHRMNHEGLFAYVEELLSNDTIERLKQFGEVSINRQIITTLLTAVKPLHYHFVKTIILKLQKLANDDERSITTIQQYQHERRKKLFFDRYKILIIIIATILICLLIFITGR